MTDVELARAFERGAIAGADFHHEQHLRVAWVYLSEYPSIESATAKMAEELLRFATRHGQASKYSDEVTRIWMERLAEARRAMPGATFEDVVAARPDLLDFKATTKSRRHEEDPA